ncbi:MAG: acetyl-CoA carboxylase carboxyl transferase subunit beta, partial [Planctomycetota bacterium]
MGKKAKATWNGFSLKPRKEMPEGLWVRCPGCEHMLYKSAVEKNRQVCPTCDHHFRIDAPTRIQYLADEDTFQPTLEDMTSGDPLGFKFRGTTYKARMAADEKKSGAREAMQIGKAFIKGRGVVLGVMEPNFLMGSMGAV